MTKKRAGRSSKAPKPAARQPRKSRAVQPQPERPPRERPASVGSDDHAFPVVGIGASAGGLEAVTRLLHHISSDAGLAYVLVQHLAPKHESVLPGLIGASTTVPGVIPVPRTRGRKSASRLTDLMRSGPLSWSVKT